MNHNQWLCKTPHDLQPMTQYKSQWFTTTGSAKLFMIYNRWLGKAHIDSQPMAQHTLP
jgi:hypothetical protein